jgi:hypothetical protein
MIVADFDPGTLTGFGAVVLTIALVTVLSLGAGAAFCLKSPKAARGFLIAAAICAVAGICVAVAIIWLSQEGVVHLL